MFLVSAVASVRRGETIAIVTRQPQRWNLPEEPGIVVYSSQQARAAHMTPGSPGGRAILERLTKG